MVLIENISPANAAKAATPRVGLNGLQILKTLRIWAARHRQRRKLAGLEPHLLKDIGITRDEAVTEAAKPFWID